MRIEALEPRALLSAVSVAAVPAPAPGDTVIPIHAQVGGTAVENILGIATKINSIEQAIDAYLDEIPGWHLTGGIDTTPTYSGAVDGSLDIGANGLLKSATVTLAASADIGAAIEGYYGISVLHVGVGVAADVSANVNATASYVFSTNTWSFGGSASLVGYVKGYASAMAWPVKGEVYVQGNVTAGAALNAQTGLASASMSVVGSVGADAQIQSFFGGWTTVASVSHNLGAWQGTASFNVGTWLKSEVGSVAAANVPVVPAVAAPQVSAPTVAVATLATTANSAAPVAVQPVAAVGQASVPVQSPANGIVAASSVAPVAAPAPASTSLDASALHQAAIASLLNEGLLAA
jgi:hypothetical protein